MTKDTSKLFSLSFWEIPIEFQKTFNNKRRMNKLKKWAKNPNRKLVCIFCGTQYAQNEIFEECASCILCQEYKGLEPDLGEKIWKE